MIRDNSQIYAVTSILGNLHIIYNIETLLHCNITKNTNPNNKIKHAHVLFLH